jgi:hypothetical protein
VVPCRLTARSWRRPLIGRMGPRIMRREHCVNKNNIVFYSARHVFLCYILLPIHHVLLS